MCSVYYNLFACILVKLKLLPKRITEIVTCTHTVPPPPPCGHSGQLCLGTQVINYHLLRVILLCHLGVTLLGEEAAELSSLTMKGDLIFSESAWLRMPKVRRDSSCKVLQFLNNHVWGSLDEMEWQNDLVIILSTGQS